MTYTHGHHPSVLRAHTWRTAENSAAYLLPHLQPGASLLDVGCGPATITLDFARLLAPGHVVGVDAAAAILEQAGASAREAGIANVSFRQAKAEELPFDDASFDIVHAHQLLQHVPDPVVVLAEMKRVCVPGGLVAARDGDYASFTWWPEDPVLEEWRALYRSLARRNGGEPDAGRRLKGWAMQAGFEEVRSSASTWCYSTTEEREWWGELWAERVTSSSIAGQAVESGLADERGLERLAAAWRKWAHAPDGWFAVVHGEILCSA